MPSKPSSVPFALEPPSLQLAFARHLEKTRVQCLQEALLTTVSKLSIPALDKELSEHAEPSALGVLAGHGLRGELVFATPLVLRASPRLLTYYRLLLGYSQKAFYSPRSGSGLGRFRSLENAGIMTPATDRQLPRLVATINTASSHLVSGLANQSLSCQVLDQLCLLTLGPQLRGSEHNSTGRLGLLGAWDAVRAVYAPYLVGEGEAWLEAAGPSGRVRASLSPDPDILVERVLGDGSRRPLVAIEVKSGTDVANVHNRIGEAEKSHLKAKAAGFAVCWTILNAPVDLDTARQESPTTDRFFDLAALQEGTGAHHRDFRRLLMEPVAT